MTFTTRALGLGVSLAVALSACGGSGSTGSTGSAGSTPSGAASSAAAAPSVPAAGSTVTGTALADRLSAAMTASPNTALTLTVTGGDGATGTGSLSFAADGSALQLTIPQADSGDDPVTMIQTADALYVDGATAGVTGGKKWARISKVSDKAGMFTALFGILAIGTTSFTNPDGLLRALAVTPSLTVKAADATSVTYTATLTPEAGFQLFPVTLFGGDQKARNDLAKQSTGDTAQLTLETDAEGRPTKVTYSVTSEGKPATIATGYTGWGSGKPVAVPDEATVMEAAELDKQFTS